MKKLIMGVLLAMTTFSAAQADIVRVETAYSASADIHRFYFIDENGGERYLDGNRGHNFGQALEHVLNEFGAAAARATVTAQSASVIDSAHPGTTVTDAFVDVRLSNGQTVRLVVDLSLYYNDGSAAKESEIRTALNNAEGITLTYGQTYGSYGLEFTYAGNTYTTVATLTQAAYDAGVASVPATDVTSNDAMVLAAARLRATANLRIQDPTQSVIESNFQSRLTQIAHRGTNPNYGTGTITAGTWNHTHLTRNDIHTGVSGTVYGSTTLNHGYYHRNVRSTGTVVVSVDRKNGADNTYTRRWDTGWVANTIPSVNTAIEGSVYTLIDTLLDDVWNDGWDEGWHAGYSEGFNDGYSEGHRDGFAQGYTAGVAAVN